MSEEAPLSIPIWVLEDTLFAAAPGRRQTGARGWEIRFDGRDAWSEISRCPNSADAILLGYD